MKMMDKKNKLKKIYDNLPQERAVDFSSLEKGLSELKEKLQEDVMVWTMEDVNDTLDDLKKTTEPLLEKFEELKSSVTTQGESLYNSFQEKVSEFESSLNEINQAIGSLSDSSQEERNSLKGKIDSLKSIQDSMSSSLTKPLEEKITALKEEFKKDLEGALGGANNNITSLSTTFKSDIKNIESKLSKSIEDSATTFSQLLDTTRVEILSRNQGGGAMNRQIKVNGVDVLTRYTDINLIGTITTSNDNVDKNVDIDLSGLGTPGGSDTQVQYNNAGAFGGISTVTTDGTIVTYSANGIDATPTDRIILANSTAAAAGVQQMSPSIHWSGHGWKTNATAASQDVDFRAHVLPVQSTVNPTAFWQLQSSINGAAWANRLTVDSAGQLAFNLASANTLTTVALNATGTITLNNASLTASRPLKINSSKVVVTGTISLTDTADTSIGSLGANRIPYVNGAPNVLTSSSNFTFNGTTLTLPGGMIVQAFLSGTWLGLPTTGPSAIGPAESVGGETWLGYVAISTQYMPDSIAGDIVYRTGGSIRWGAGPDSGSTSQMRLTDHDFGVGLGSDTIAARIHSQSADIADSCSGTASTGCDSFGDEGSCVAVDGCSWNGSACEGTITCTSVGDQGTCEGYGCTWGGAAAAIDQGRWSQDSSNYCTLHVDASGNTTFNVVGTSPIFKFADTVAPNANDGSALGNTSLQWSDLFLAEGGVINFDNGDLTLTQTGNTLALAGGGLDIQGSLQCDSITNDTGLASGTYTPTRSAESNLDSNVTMFDAQYLRVGNTVTVSGRFTADPTLTATATSFEMTLPIASNFGAVEDCAGVAFCGAIAGQGSQISGSVANNTMVVTWVATDVTSQSWSFTATYQVI